MQNLISRLKDSKMDTRVKSIEFIEDKHEYWFTDEQGRHRRLHGVTGAVGKLMRRFGIIFILI